MRWHAHMSTFQVFGVERFVINTDPLSSRKCLSNIRFFNFQIVSHYRIEKHRVARTIAERKTWKKYGLSKNDKPGPNPATTITAEDVFMHVGWGLAVGEGEKEQGEP